MTDSIVAPLEKRFYILKTNGINNIRTINAGLKVAPEMPNFWMAGYMKARKFRKTTVLRKEFFFYDYVFIELTKPLEFEKFLLDRKIPAYFLHGVGTKMPIALTIEEIESIKQLEVFKQLEADAFKDSPIQVGAVIEVTHGPFIGCKGIVLEVTATHAVLEMNVFERPTRVAVSLEFLKDLLQTYNEPISCEDASE